MNRPPAILPRGRQAVRALASLLVIGLVFTRPALAEMSSEELAKLAQNPIANLISVPFQNNTNCNFKGGTYLTSAPILTVNWDADSADQWTVPLGGGIGHIFHLGRLPVNSQIGAYYNVVKPDDGADWQLRFQVQLMFPK